MQLCRICYTSKYHEYHEFILRPSPDKDWEPVFRTSPLEMDEEYVRIMRELQSREITPDDYERLLALD